MHPSRIKDETDQRAAEREKALSMLNDECKNLNTARAMLFGGYKAAVKFPLTGIGGGGFWMDVYNELHGSFLGASMAFGVQNALALSSKTSMFYFLHHFCVFTPINTRLKLVPANRGKKKS